VDGREVPAGGVLHDGRAERGRVAPAPARLRVHVLVHPVHEHVGGSARDDQINGSFGFKFSTGPGIMVVANTLWPLNRGGLRPNVLWTAGLEYNF